MSLGKGYWFVASNFDLIDIVEHESYLRDLSNAMWTNPSSLGLRERAQAESLGMKEGEPWLPSVPRETPAVKRERWLVAAMKKGWVRVRQAPNRVIVFETWKVNDDMMASIAMAVKKLELSPDAWVEVHDVSKDKSIETKASALLAMLAGEEVPAEVGFSVYSNPGGEKLGHIRGREHCARREYPAGVAVLGGRGRLGPLGNWNPLEEPQLFGRFMSQNPRQQQAYIDVEAGEGETVAQVFIGLAIGFKKKIKRIDPMEVFRWVKAFRKKQLGDEAPGGASFIAQKGFFTHWMDHSSGVVDEDSLQIVFFPDGRAGAPRSEMTDKYKPRFDVFEKHMHELAPAIADAFKQKVVVLRLVLNGKMSYFGDYH